MGPDARERPNANLAHAFAGIGGALAGIGLIVAVTSDRHPESSVMVASGVVFAIALALRLMSHRDNDVRPAAVGAGLIGLGGFIIAFIALTEIRFGLGLLAGFGLFLAAWLSPGFRGRSAFLAVAALMLVFGVSTLVAGSPWSGSNSDSSCDPYSYQPTFDSSYDPSLDPTYDPSTTSTYYPDSYDCSTSSNPFDQLFGNGGRDEAPGIIVLLLGGLLAIGVWQLDRRGYHGVATSLVAATLLSVLGGTGSLYAALGGEGATLVTAGVGIVISLVGHAGKRRAMTWWGSGITAVGLVAFVAIAMEPEKKASIAALLVLVGAALIVVPMVLARMRRAPSSASSPASTPPPQAPPTA